MPLEPSSLYKDVQTSRGMNYHYYYSPASEDKPTLLLLHGYPSTSYDWRYQVAFFKDKGYGLIVLDMLGYGGTSKPLDVAQYRYSLISKDIVDIFDAEKIDKAVVIGHDWGSRVASRFVQHYPERVQALGLLAVGYIPPTVQFDYEKVLASLKEHVGYEALGYWSFFSQNESVKIIEENREKFINVLFPEDPNIWKTDFVPRGAFEETLTAKSAHPIPSWIPLEELRIASDDLFAGGIAAPNHWYKYIFSSHLLEDDAIIPKDRYEVSKPTFFGAASKDFVGVAHVQIRDTTAMAENLTVREFDANHWLHLQRPDEVNSELESWLGGI